MEQLSRGQRLTLVGAALALAVIFAANVVYWTAFAPEHPRIKHDVLFVALMVTSLLVAWFAWPPARVNERQR